MLPTAAGLKRTVPQQDDEPDTIEPIVSPRLTLIVSNLSSDDPVVQFLGLTNLRTELAVGFPSSADQFVTCGVFAVLLRILNKTTDPVIQIGVLSSLTSIVSTRPAQSDALVRAKGVTSMIPFLSPTTVPHICQLAVLALAQMVEVNSGVRDQVIQLGTIDSLAILIPEAPIVLLGLIARVFSNLTRHVTTPPISLEIVAKILAPTAEFMTQNDVEVLRYATQTISNLAGMGARQIQMLVDKDLDSKLISLLPHLDYIVRAVAIEGIAKISTHGTPEQNERLFARGVLSHFGDLLTVNFLSGVTTQYIARQAAQFLINTVEKIPSKLQAVIDDAQIVPILISHVNSESDLVEGSPPPPPLQLEISAYTLCNLVRIEFYKKEYYEYFDSCGIIPAFCSLLTIRQSKPFITQVALVGLINLMTGIGSYEIDKIAHWCQLIKMSDGPRKMRKLVTHEHKEIREISAQILHLYFSKEAEAAAEADVKKTNSSPEPEKAESSQSPDEE